MASLGGNDGFAGEVPRLVDGWVGFGWKGVLEWDGNMNFIYVFDMDVINMHFSKEGWAFCILMIDVGTFTQMEMD